jgi:uncharacterized membrane protein
MEVISMDGKNRHTTAIPPGIAAAAAYFFPFIGGLVMLAIEKEDRFVRFHAAQSIVFWACACVIALLLFWIPVIKDIYALVLLAAWVFLIYQAWTNKEFEIPYLSEIARKQIFGKENGPAEPEDSNEGEGPQV